MISNSISASFKLPMMSSSWSSPNSWQTFEMRTMRFDVNPFFPLTSAYNIQPSKRTLTTLSIKMAQKQARCQCINCGYLKAILSHPPKIYIGLSTQIVSLLAYWYSHQHVCVRWRNALSSSFTNKIR